MPADNIGADGRGKFGFRNSKSETISKCVKVWESAGAPIRSSVFQTFPICFGFPISRIGITALPARVMMQRPVVRPIDMQHDRAPVERQQQQPPAGAGKAREHRRDECETAPEH